MPSGIYNHKSPSMETKEKNRLSHLGKKYKPMSKEGKENIRNSILGSKTSIEIRTKISNALKGRMPKFIPNNTGMKRTEETKKRMSLSKIKEKNPNWGKPRSKETRRKIGLGNKGKIISEKQKQEMSKKRKGIRVSPQTEFKKGMNVGQKNNNWKGGITPENQKIRHSIEYKLFINSVFARDGYTCQKYGTKGGKIHAHHILNFAEYPELRFAIDNGITLSEKAHNEFHKKYSRKNNTQEQLEKFLSDLKINE